MQLSSLSIRQVNWILIGLYFLFCLAQLIFSNWKSMDAAGRGMAGGFLMVYFFFVLVMAGLNLIQVKWVSTIVLVICVLPLAIILLRVMQRGL